MAKTQTYSLRDGDSEIRVEAVDLADAREQADDWARGGSYDDDGTYTYVDVRIHRAARQMTTRSTTGRTEMKIREYDTHGTGPAAYSKGQVALEGDDRAIDLIVTRLERTHQLRATSVERRDGDAEVWDVCFVLGDRNPLRTHRNAATVVSAVVVTIW